MGNYTILSMFENPRRGRQARNFTTNAPKILDLKSSFEQIFSRKLPLGAPESMLVRVKHTVSLRYRCTARHLLQFFTLSNLRIQTARVGVFLCVQLTSLDYFLRCPVLSFTINALVILTGLYWQTKVK